ncbi:ATP synthase F0 subunit B [Bacillus marasmi]|uniref:F0F1 ATP synthase subunit B family protein n=1 Tax=Bacillus marasmi TaxID=1926279 RepID=UPI0011C92CBE|nr:ATP synthase F0 subunit B [Bacillus marasmi]
MGDFEIFGMPVSLGTMIYQAILFTVLIFILKNKLLNKVVEAMEKRRDTIENELNLAETYKLEAEANMMRQRELTEQATHEARKTIAAGRAEATSIVKEARKEALMIRTQAFNDGHPKKKKTVQGVRGA